MKPKENIRPALTGVRVGSIHPQGWVPIETNTGTVERHTARENLVAFTPKGGCPLKRAIFPARRLLQGFL